MKRIGIVAVSAATLCWAMYEVSSDNTNTAPRSESNQKVASKNISSNTRNEKLAPQMLLAQTNSLNSSTPVCKYNFNATQEDFDLWNNEYPDFPIKIFPSIIGQKFGFKVEPRPESEYGYVDYVATSKINSPNSINEIGDLTIPHTGIIAFEMELKIPTSTLGSSSLGNSTYYSSSIGFSGVTNNGYTIRSNYWFDMGGYDPDFGENPARLNYYVAYRLSDNSGPNNPYYKGQNMTNNSNEYQRLGMYINQNTKQVGFIVNGVDQGYQSTLPAPLENEPYRVCRRVNILRDYPDDKTKLYPRN